MRYYFVILGLIIFNFYAHSQQVKLYGQICLHNSKLSKDKLKYVNGSFITAPYSKPFKVVDSGKFELEFVNIALGTPIKINVETNGYEVVNDDDLRKVIIGRKLPLNVYLTTKGQLAFAQTEFYNISLKAIYAERDAKITKLSASVAESKIIIAELEKKFGRKIADRFEAEKLLNAKVEELKKRLPEFAQSMAYQNLDFASDMYVKAYEYFEKGNIEKAIEELDESQLEKSYQNAKESFIEGERLDNLGKDIKEKSLLQIDQVIKSLELKAASFSWTFNFIGSATIYEKIIEKYSSHNPASEKLANYYLKAAKAFYDGGQFEKALKLLQTNIKIHEEIPEIGHAAIAKSYSLIGIIYSILGQYEKSLKYQDTALNSLREISNSKSLDLALVYCNIGGAYYSLHEYDKALNYQKKDLSILQELLDSNNTDLAGSYGNIANTYLAMGNYELAMKYQQNCTEIFTQVLDSTHPDLLGSYINLGNIYNVTGEKEKALAIYQKVIEKIEQSSGPKKPDLAFAYTNAGDIYYLSGQFEKAIECYKQGIKFKEVLLPGHYTLAHTNYSLGRCYLYLKEYSQAIEYLQISVKISPVLKDSFYYNDIGIAFAKSGQFDKAKSAFTEFEDLSNDKSKVFKDWCIYYALRDEKNKALTNLKMAIDLGYDDLNVPTDESIENILGDSLYTQLMNDFKNSTN
ncbi:MAG: tetratricopeptide repeat protein [Ferruginibacter sp.]